MRGTLERTKTEGRVCQGHGEGEKEKETDCVPDVKDDEGAVDERVGELEGELIREAHVI